MKGIIIFSLIFLAGLSLASAYTPEQQTTLEGMRLSFQLGQAYQQAQAGQNAAGFNALVDQYNAFIRTNFGEDPNLLMSKINGAWAGPKNLIEQKTPFNASSDLSKFGKQQVLTQIPSGVSKELAEDDLAWNVLNNF
ncbi:MAG: hypothetical protein NTV25_07955 [Methanothrix sp.]|nr:hypothetical protein [Methanothrix sp.]